VVFAVALGFVMAMLDVTVVNVALGDIQREFTSPFSMLVMITDAYTLTFASLLLLTNIAKPRFKTGARWRAGTSCWKFHS
jgi:DHA2 family methylenomycin A resistance protein-like MFS transporter